ncbi:MAG: redoxin family protein [Betaproteobacteria bacterium]|nr:redoxin family protein [Betaproteobacteria bacterium]
MTLASLPRKISLARLGVSILLICAAVPAMAGTPGQARSTSAVATPGQIAPDAPFTTVDGKVVQLDAYKGRPVIVWQVTTWCPSCAAGLRTFAHHQARIDHSDVTVLVLRDYDNGGYPGPGIRAFASSVAAPLLKDPHFVFGEDTKALFDRYNPRKFVDIYQVIAADGHVRLASSSPSATFGRIEAFLRPRT